jgi:hypothetical protein
VKATNCFANRESRYAGRGVAGQVRAPSVRLRCDPLPFAASSQFPILFHESELRAFNCMPTLLSNGPLGVAWGA